VVVSFSLLSMVVTRTLFNIGKFCLVVVGPSTFCKFSNNTSLLIINFIVVELIGAVETVKESNCTKNKKKNQYFIHKKI
jgi:uncharacterized membrane protein